MIAADTARLVRRTWLAACALSWFGCAPADTGGTTELFSERALSLSTSFQHGVNGYAGLRDVQITNQYVENGQITRTQDRLLLYRKTGTGAYESEGLLRFDGLSLPENSQVTGATLQFTFENWTTGFSIRGKYLQAFWNPDEGSGLGWAQRGDGSSWSVPGARGAGTDLRAEPGFVIGGFTGAGEEVKSVELDPAVVQDWIDDPETNEGILLYNETADQITRVHSSDDAVVARRPRLTVTYDTADTTPPAVAMTAPASGATLSGVVTLSAQASDNVGVVGVRFSIDGNPVGAEDTAAPHSISFDTTALANGAHTFSAVARDAAGNQATATAVSATVNNSGVLSVSFQDDVNGYGGTRDVSVTNQYVPNGQTTHDGTTLLLYRKTSDGPYESQALLRFDGISLPAGSSVTTATLKLTFQNWVTGFTVRGYYLNSQWNAAVGSQLGWLYRDANLAWAVPGARGIGTDLMAGPSFAVTNVATGADVVRTIALDPAVVQSWISNPASNSGVLLINESADQITRIYSGDEASVARHPVLTVTYSTGTDTTPPAVAVTAPSGGATVSGVIELAANASDPGGSGVVGVQFLADGAPVGSEDTLAPYALSFDTRGLADGSHAFSARARDAAGNMRTSTAVTITVDNPSDVQPPSVALTAPSSGSTLTGTVSVSANASDTGSGVAGVQFLADGNPIGAEDTTSPYSISFDTRALAQGSHILSALARDAAGNSAAAQGVAVIVDNPPAPSGPQTITLVPNGGTGTAELVTVGIPFADGAFFDTAQLVVRNASGSTVPVFVKPTLHWHWTSGSIRALKVQFVANMSQGQVTYSFETGTARNTATDRAESALSTIAGKAGQQVPRVLATLHPEWLCDSRIAGPQQPKTAQTPYDTFFEAQWAWAQNTDYSAYSSWLFDRPSPIYKQYIRTGGSAYLKEAFNSHRFYISHIGADGTFDLKPGDTKYIYTEPVLLHVALTGDDTALAGQSKVNGMADAFWTDVGDLVPYSQSHSFWTERDVGLLLLSQVAAFELAQNASDRTKYESRVTGMVPQLYAHQQTNPDGRGNDGSWRHDWGVHEGSYKPLVDPFPDGPPLAYCAQGGCVGGSPWMTQNLIDGLWHAWLVLAGQEPALTAQIETMVKDYALMFMENHGWVPDNWYTTFEDWRHGCNPDTGTSPHYFGSSVMNAPQATCTVRGQPCIAAINDSEGWYADQHNPELAMVVAAAYYFSSDPAERQILRNRMDRIEQYFNASCGAISATPRSFNWAHRGTAVSQWMLEQ